VASNSDPIGQKRPSSSLASLGFDEGRAAEAVALENGRADLVPARIVAVHRDRSAALTADSAGGLCDMHLRLGAAMKAVDAAASDRPAVGDWVLVRSVPGLDGTEGAAGIVDSILPRRGFFARKVAGLRQEAQVLAANVDLCLIATAAGRDFNPRRIERYLALAWEGGSKPILVVTKADLADDPEELVQAAESLAFGAPVVATSAIDGRGMAELRSLLVPGSTAVLLGSSGAGKSTLLNALAEKDLAATGEVREDDQRGRHTTTARELFVLASGAMVIDTPGLREIQLWADEGGVDDAFPEIEELVALCRFRDCAHEAEPGCAVRTALEEGRLDPDRHASWRKLRREIAWLDRREDPSLARAAREKWRTINQAMRGYTKERRSIQGSSR